MLCIKYFYVEVHYIYCVLPSYCYYWFSFENSTILFLSKTSLFLALEDELADSRELDGVADEQEDTGHDSSVVVGQLGCDQVRTDGESKETQDEEIDAVVPAISKGFPTFREISQ